MYIIRNKTTKEVIRKSKTPISIDGEIKDLDPNLEVLEVIQNDRPTYNPETSKLERTETEQGGQIIIDWNIVDLSAEELQAIQDQKDAEAERQQAKAIYLDLKKGVGTAGERLTRVEKVLARLLRDMYGN